MPYRSSLSPAQNQALENWLSLHLNGVPQVSWLNWLEIAEEKAALEYALTQLSCMGSGNQAYQIKEILDELAADFALLYPGGSIEQLMHFLFVEQAYTSPPEEAPNCQYDNLAWVLQHKKGSQVALSCLAILVAHRLDIPLDGISIQGNFITISFAGEKMQMFNSFNQGQPLARASVMYIEEAFRRNQIAPGEMKAEVHEIVIQILKNGIEANHRLQKLEEARRYIGLYKELIQELQYRGMEA
ncbi:MAG: transglutaminase family protein [Bacteroidota bacterium]